MAKLRCAAKVARRPFACAPIAMMRLMRISQLVIRWIKPVHMVYNMHNFSLRSRLMAVISMWLGYLCAYLWSCWGNLGLSLWGMGQGVSVVCVMGEGHI